MKPIPFRSLLPTLFVTASAWLAGGCASYRIQVDAISRTDSAASALTSYTLQNKNPAIDPDSLRYREAAQRIKTALSGRGLWEAPNPAEAALIVELEYAAEPARVVYQQVEVPVYVPTGSPSGSISARQQFGTTMASVPMVLSEKHLSVSCRENKPAAEGCPAVELWQVSASLDDTDTALRESLPILAAQVMNQIGHTTPGTIDRRLATDDPAVAFVQKGL